MQENSSTKTIDEDVPQWVREPVDPNHVRRDVAMLSRAVKARWSVPERLRPYLVQRAELLLRTSNNANAVLRAAMIILAADAQNMKQEQWEWEKEFRLREEARQVAKDALGASQGPTTAVQVNVTTHAGGVAAVDFSSLLAGATIEELRELEKKFVEIAQRPRRQDRQNRFGPANRDGDSLLGLLQQIKTANK